MKLSALILAFICVFAIVGCNSNTATDKQAPDPTPNSWGVTLEAENITASGLNYSDKSRFVKPEGRFLRFCCLNNIQAAVFAKKTCQNTRCML